MPTITLDEDWANALSRDLDMLKVATSKAKTPSDRRKVGDALLLFSSRLHELLIDRMLGDDNDPYPVYKTVVPPKARRDITWVAFHRGLFWPAAHLCSGLARLGGAELDLAAAEEMNQDRGYINAILDDFSRERKLFFTGNSTVKKFFAAFTKSQRFLIFPGQTPVQVFYPNHTDVRIAGFNVDIVGAEDERVTRGEVERLARALSTFRSRMARVAPKLMPAIKTVSLVADLTQTKRVDRARLSVQGEFSPFERTITFFPQSVPSGNDNEYVHLIAHELGHVIFRSLDDKTGEAWYALIRGDMTRIELAELLSVWPKDADGHPVAMNKLFDALKDAHPILALQIEAVRFDPVTRDSFWKNYAFLKEAHDIGALKTIRVPGTPITGYANKNPEEAFCEAFGLLVGYGPRTLLPQVYLWLETVLGADIRRGTAAGVRRRPSPRRRSTMPRSV